jgi:hypothetical protein
MALAEASAAFAAFAPTFESEFTTGLQARVDDIFDKFQAVQKAAAASVLAGTDTGYGTATSNFFAALSDLGSDITNQLLPGQPEADTYLSALGNEL